MPNDMDFFDFLSQHSLEDVLSAIIQYQLENLMHDGEQLSLAEYAAANALYACPQNGISPLTRNANLTTLIISKKPGNTGISRDIRTEFTTDLLL